jgi:hypothetical protein
MSEDEISEIQDTFYLRRLDSGLFTLQLVDYIVGEVCVHGGDEVDLTDHQYKDNHVAILFLGQAQSAYHPISAQRVN